MQQSGKAAARTVLWAAAGIQFISGILYVWSIISKQLITEYGWTNTEASLPYMLVTLVDAVVMVFAGRFQDKKGPRLAATIGSVLTVAGLFLSAFAKTPAMLTVTFSLILGTGLGFIGSCVLPCPVKWFSPSKKGLITGILVGGVSLAAIFYSPFINYLANTYNLTTVFFVLSAITLITILLSQLLRDPPIGFVPQGGASAPRHISQGRELDWHEMLKTRGFYMLWFMFMISASAGLMIISQMANIAFFQAGWEGGYLLVALLAVFNTLGRLVGGALSDRIGRIWTIRLIFSLQAVNMICFSFFASAVTLAIGAMVAGFCYGTGLAVFPAFTSDLFGMKNLGVNNGLVFTGWGAGGLIGTLAAGMLHDATGSYTAAYMVALGLLITGLAITVVFARSARRVKES